MLAKLFSPGEEGTDGSSSCAVHRQVAGLEIGLEVSLESTLTAAIGSDSVGLFARGSPGQLSQPARSPHEASLSPGWSSPHRDLTWERQV